MVIFTAHNNSKALRMLIIKPIALTEPQALHLVTTLLVPYMEYHHFTLVKLRNNSWRFRIDGDEFIAVNTGLPVALIFHTKEANNKQFDRVVWFGSIDLSTFNDKKWEIEYVTSGMRRDIRSANCRLALFRRPKVGEEQLRLTGRRQTIASRAAKGEASAQQLLVEAFADPDLFPQPNTLATTLTTDPTLTFNYQAEIW